MSAKERVKEHVQFFLRPDRLPIKREIYLSIVKSAEEAETARSENNTIKILNAELKLVYHNLLGVFDNITYEEASLAMRTGFQKAIEKKENKE